jgi:outer membrane protein insertion porin family
MVLVGGAAPQSGVSPLVRTRAALLASAFIVPLVLGGVSARSVHAQGIVPGTSRPNALPSAASRSPASAPDVYAQALQLGATIGSIRVEGNQRIEEGTIRSYMLVAVGDQFDSERLDRSLKSLYATGLFSDVVIRREANILVVRVAENPIVNRILFEGNKKVTDELLRPEMTLRPRAVFTPALAAIDRQKVLDLYAKRGRFGARAEPKIIQLDQNRVDVVFEIDDGTSTLISRIAFVGNQNFSESKLKDVVGSREQAFWRLLSTADSYDPDRVGFDKELLRRFYLKSGYADVEINSAIAELSPDKQSFFVTFNVTEGARYRVGEVKVTSALRNLDSAVLAPFVVQQKGDWYDGESVERSIQAITTEVQNRGYAFVEVKPRIQRDKEKRTVELVFDVGEGPRVYVERIDIQGNVRTKDSVIRREFRLAEGDAFSAALLRRSRQRLDDLGYFNTVTVGSTPGSAPDKAVVATNVDEKATGELTIGGGYSTDAGALANLGLRERNLIGSGVDAGINTILAQKRTQLDLSITDPYFLDRNLVGSVNAFAVQSNNQLIAQYSERRVGLSASLGYEFSEHLRQSWTYSLVNRSVYNINSLASLYVQDSKGTSLLSQIGQTLSLDYRDSRVDPKSGSLWRVGTDYAGLGGNVQFGRMKIDGTYYLPLEFLFNDPDYVLAISGGAGYFASIGKRERIIDRFFLGGDNLRGFQSGGAGPHATDGGDSLGGRAIWTQSTEFRFPLPLSPDLGLSGRTFVDLGALSGIKKQVINGIVPGYVNFSAPRLGAGVGVSWKTPFGLINIDIAPVVIKQKYDQTQFFRFGFGTRF